MTGAELGQGRKKRKIRQRCARNGGGAVVLVARPANKSQTRAGRDSKYQRGESDQRKRRGRASPQRCLGPGNDPHILSVEPLLLAGFPRAHQKGFVNGATGLYISFKLAQ